MSNVVLQQGDTAILDRLRLDNNALKTLRLFQNNHTPGVADVNANYTEATFTGYASVALGTWNPAFLNGSNQGEIDANPVTFTRTAGATSNTIYGAYVTDNAGDVVYAEKFSAPITMASTGDTFTYTPRFTAVSA
jgi:hypothetical protein